ncbi:MAG: redoxin domain-containing protein [Pirellulales bacterium]|nr:redoxin domain-containing protein [Pirellulales bacterium]
MIRAVLMTMAVCLIALPSAALAQDAQGSDAAKELQSLQAEQSQAVQEHRAKVRAAETREERAKLTAENPAEKFAPRFLELAEKYPGTEESLTALQVAMRARDSEVQNKALAIILRDHKESKALGTMVSGWARDASKADALRQIIDASPHREVKGLATYSLATLSLRSARNDEAKREAAIKLLQQAVEVYGDVEIRNRTIKQVAGGQLTEITKLQIGMEAPDIEGTDVDDVAFKLSDYRGKVVVLDFWGDW